MANGQFSPSSLLQPLQCASAASTVRHQTPKLSAGRALSSHRGHEPAQESAASNKGCVNVLISKNKEISPELTSYELIKETSQALKDTQTDLLGYLI